ncbi:MAG: type II/IV secretion system protein, partial [Desulfobacterales bacterium]|nr:type II/IV secretion system protein [Desulfobacterales bacterium]
GVLAQRLVRKICKYCKESFEMDTEELKNSLGIHLKKKGPVKLFQGKGCTKCRGTGYHGRAAIFEVLPFTDPIKQLTNKETDLSAIKKKAREEGMVTLRENAVKKLLSGATTYNEVLRVTMEHY